jgi:hypothetical protein
MFLIFGILMYIIVPPMSTPDEELHFAKNYVYGKTISAKNKE